LPGGLLEYEARVTEQSELPDRDARWPRRGGRTKRRRTAFRTDDRL